MFVKIEPQLLLVWIGLSTLTVGCTQGYNRHASLPVGATALTVPTYALAQSPTGSTSYPSTVYSGPTYSSVPAAPSTSSPSHVQPSGPIASLTPVPQVARTPNEIKPHPPGTPPVNSQKPQAPKTQQKPAPIHQPPAQAAAIPQPLPAQTPPPRSLASSAVAASTPLDNPVPIPAQPVKPAEIPNAGTNPPPIPPLGGEMADPFAPSASKAKEAASPIPPIARAVPDPIPKEPPAAQSPMKETSLAWAVWPFTPRPEKDIAPIADPIQGARALLPYRVATKPGSNAKRASRARIAGNTAIASAIPADPLAPEAAKPIARRGVHYRGGKTMKEMAYVNLYLGGEEHWKQSDVLKIDDNIKAAMTDANLNAVLKQYFNGQAVKTVPLSSHPLLGEMTKTLTRADIHQTLRSLHAQGYLDDFDLDVTVFNILCPSGIVLSDDVKDVDSLNGLAGYHGSIKADLDSVYYTVIAASETRPDGTENGIAVFADTWKNVVAMLYHQMQEVRTNPDAEDVLRQPDDPKMTERLGWVSDSGEEIGDLLLNDAKELSSVITEVPLANGSGTVPIQRIYSNEDFPAEAAP